MNLDRARSGRSPIGICVLGVVLAAGLRCPASALAAPASPGAGGRGTYGAQVGPDTVDLLLKLRDLLRSQYSSITPLAARAAIETGARADFRREFDLFLQRHRTFAQFLPRAIKKVPDSADLLQGTLREVNKYHDDVLQMARRLEMAWPPDEKLLGPTGGLTMPARGNADEVARGAEGARRGDTSTQDSEVASENLAVLRKLFDRMSEGSASAAGATDGALARAAATASGAQGVRKPQPGRAHLQASAASAPDDAEDDDDDEGGTTQSAGARPPGTRATAGATSGATTGAKAGAAFGAASSTTSGATAGAAGDARTRSRPAAGGAADSPRLAQTAARSNAAGGATIAPGAVRPGQDRPSPQHPLESKVDDIATGMKTLETEVAAIARTVATLKTSAPATEGESGASATGSTRAHAATERSEPARFAAAPRGMAVARGPASFGVSRDGLHRRPAGTGAAADSTTDDDGDDDGASQAALSSPRNRSGASPGSDSGSDSDSDSLSASGSRSATQTEPHGRLDLTNAHLVHRIHALMQHFGSPDRRAAGAGTSATATSATGPSATGPSAVSTSAIGAPAAASPGSMQAGNARPARTDGENEPETPAARGTVARSTMAQDQASTLSRGPRAAAAAGAGAGARAGEERRDMPASAVQVASGPSSGVAGSVTRENMALMQQMFTNTVGGGSVPPSSTTAGVQRPATAPPPVLAHLAALVASAGKPSPRPASLAGGPNAPALANQAGPGAVAQAARGGAEDDDDDEDDAGQDGAIDPVPGAGRGAARSSMAVSTAASVAGSGATGMVAGGAADPASGLGARRANRSATGAAGQPPGQGGVVPDSRAGLVRAAARRASQDDDDATDADGTRVKAQTLSMFRRLFLARESAAAGAGLRVDAGRAVRGGTESGTGSASHGADGRPALPSVEADTGQTSGVADGRGRPALASVPGTPASTPPPLRPLVQKVDTIANGMDTIASNMQALRGQVEAIARTVQTLDKTPPVATSASRTAATSGTPGTRDAAHTQDGGRGSRAAASEPSVDDSESAGRDENGRLVAFSKARALIAHSHEKVAAASPTALAHAATGGTEGAPGTFGTRGTRATGGAGDDGADGDTAGGSSDLDDASSGRTKTLTHRIRSMIQELERTPGDNGATRIASADVSASPPARSSPAATRALPGTADRSESTAAAPGSAGATHAASKATGPATSRSLYASTHTDTRKEAASSISLAEADEDEEDDVPTVMAARPGAPRPSATDRSSGDSSPEATASRATADTTAATAARPDRRAGAVRPASNARGAPARRAESRDPESDASDVSGDGSDEDPRTVVARSAPAPAQTHAATRPAATAHTSLDDLVERVRLAMARDRAQHGGLGEAGRPTGRAGDTAASRLPLDGFAAQEFEDPDDAAASGMPHSTRPATRSGARDAARVVALGARRPVVASADDEEDDGPGPDGPIGVRWRSARAIAGAPRSSRQATPPMEGAATPAPDAQAARAAATAAAPGRATAEGPAGPVGRENLAMLQRMVNAGTQASAVSAGNSGSAGASAAPAGATAPGDAPADAGRRGSWDSSAPVASVDREQGTPVARRTPRRPSSLATVMLAQASDRARSGGLRGGSTGMASDADAGDTPLADAGSGTAPDGSGGGADRLAPAAPDVSGGVPTSLHSRMGRPGATERRAGRAIHPAAPPGASVEKADASDASGDGRPLGTSYTESDFADSWNGGRFLHQNRLASGAGAGAVAGVGDDAARGGDGEVQTTPAASVPVPRMRLGTMAPSYQRYTESRASAMPAQGFASGPRAQAAAPSSVPGSGLVMAFQVPRSGPRLRKNVGIDLDQLDGFHGPDGASARGTLGAKPDAGPPSPSPAAGQSPSASPAAGEGPGGAPLSSSPGGEMPGTQAPPFTTESPAPAAEGSAAPGEPGMTVAAASPATAASPAPGGGGNGAFTVESSADESDPSQLPLGDPRDPTVLSNFQCNEEPIYNIIRDFADVAKVSIIIRGNIKGTMDFEITRPTKARDLLLWVLDNNEIEYEFNKAGDVLTVYGTAEKREITKTYRFNPRVFINLDEIKQVIEDQVLTEPAAAGGGQSQGGAGGAAGGGAGGAAGGAGGPGGAGGGAPGGGPGGGAGGGAPGGGAAGGGAGGGAAGGAPGGGAGGGGGGDSESK